VRRQKDAYSKFSLFYYSDSELEEDSSSSLDSLLEEDSSEELSSSEEVSSSL